MAFLNFIRLNPPYNFDLETHTIMDQSFSNVNIFLYHLKSNFYKAGILSGREYSKKGKQRKVFNLSVRL